MIKKDKQDKENSDHYEDDVVIEESGDEALDSNLQGKIKKLREKLKECEDQKNKYLDDLHRTKADFVNARKQDEESNKGLVKFANEKLIKEIVPVLESFEMAFSNREAWDSVSEEWRKGVEYIHNQLLSVLESNGVEQVDPQGEVFNPEFHEALESVEIEDQENDNKVVEVVQKGYVLNSKVIKTAKVRVGKFK